MKYILISLSIFMYSNFAFAIDYQLGVDTEKPISCTDPTKRTDGSSLSPADIKEIRILVTGPGGYVKTIVMPGGCTTTPLPLSGLAAGTYQMVGLTEDTGGRVSVQSVPPIPFNLLPVIANPNPPTVLP